MRKRQNTNPLFINLRNTLPTSISLKVGQEIVFVQSTAAGSLFVHSMELPDKHFDALAFPQIVGYRCPGQPANTDLHSGAVAKSAGKGEIKVTFAPPNPMYPPYQPEVIRYTIS